MSSTRNHRLPLRGARRENRNTSASASQLAGLRRYQAERRDKTRQKLLDALSRLESGRPMVVLADFKWNKTTLAQEAGVNINTLVKKLASGEWAFPEINERFENLKDDQELTIRRGLKENKIAELRSEVKRLQEQNRLLALQVNSITDQLLEQLEQQLVGMKAESEELRKQLAAAQQKLVRHRTSRFLSAGSALNGKQVPRA